MATRVNQRTLLSSSLDKNATEGFSRFIGLLAMSLLEVVFELTFIDSAIIVDPFAFALPHSVLKLAFVVAPIGPRILPETIRLTFGVISYIFISIDKKLFT